MSSKRPWEYLSGDMNWQGAVVGLCLLALLDRRLRDSGEHNGGLRRRCGDSAHQRGQPAHYSSPAGLVAQVP